MAVVNMAAVRKQMSRIGDTNKPSVSRPEFEILVYASDPAFVEFARTEFQRAGVSAGFQSFAEVGEALNYLRREGDYPTTDLIIVDLSVSDEFVKRMKALAVPLDVPILFASAVAQPAWRELLVVILGLKTAANVEPKRIC